MRQGSGEDVCRAANTAADKVWSRQKFKNGKGLPSRENKRERVVREREGVLWVGSIPISTNHTFFLFFLKIVYHFTKCLNHCQHFSPKFKHFCLIDMARSHWSIFPLHIKSAAGSVAVLVNWFGAWAVSYSTFWLFSGFSLLTVIFVVKVVPETKGKSLEEIQVLINK
ncbi:putative major facilitator, sugar transporter, MFS transporter superfamily [Helianthus anomalus]